MGFIQFLINKLVGYDIESKQKELEQSVSSLQKEKEEQTYSIKYLNTRIITLEREKSNSDILVNELRASLNELEIKNQSLTKELCVSKADGEEQRHHTTQAWNQLNAYKNQLCKSQESQR